MKKILIITVGIFLFSNFNFLCFAETFDFSELEENFDSYDDLTLDENLDSENIVDAKNSEIIDESYVGKVSLSGEMQDGDILKISATANDFQSPVVGVAFHLLYENNKLAFLKYEPGEFLEKGGDPFYLVNDIKENGEIVFGETLRKDDSFPVGGNVIAIFYFQITDDEIFNFNFKNGIVSSMDEVRQDLDKINWEDFSFDKNNPEKALIAGKINTPQNIWIDKFLPAIFAIAAIFSSYFLIRFIKNSKPKKNLRVDFS